MIHRCRLDDAGPGLLPAASAAFARDGIVVIEAFASPAACAALRERALQLVAEFAPQAPGTVFSTRDQLKDRNLTVAGCGGGCTVLNRAAGGGQFFIDGNALPNAPKWIANVTGRYGIPTASGGEYFVYTDWAYRSETSFFLYSSKEFTGPSLLEGGVRVGYNWGNGKYEAAIFGRNITNQIRVTGGIDFNNLTGFINEPRTYGVQFKANF